VAASVWRDRAVFLTGGNGFVGSWTARALVDAGARVVALVRDRVPNGGLRLQGLLDRVSCVHGDLLDAPLLQRAVAEYEVTVCLHLGAQAMVGVAHRCPTGTFGANVMGTANLLEACRLAGVRHVVLASSDKVYGAADRLPYREDTPLLGSAPYEASKVCAELAATSYARTYGLSIAAARCANVYGGGDLNFSRLVPETMRAVLAGRGYLYAEDAARAYLSLGAHCLTRMRPGEMEVFNFGWGRGVSVLELVERIIRISGATTLVPEAGGAGAGHEIQDQWLDSTRAREVLRWCPEIDLDRGLALTLDWYRGHLGHGRPTAADDEEVGTAWTSLSRD